VNKALNALNNERTFVDELNYLSAPLEVFLNITWNCNLRCSFCYLKAPRTVRRPLLNLNEIKSLIDELVEMKVSLLTLTGGEPFLNAFMTLETLKYARKKGLAVTITTNGLLIDENIAKTLAEYNVSVQISLEGSKAEVHDSLTGLKGSFEKAIKVIKMLRKMGVDVTVSTVLQRDNVDDISDMIPLLKELDVYTWNILELKPIGRGCIASTLPTNIRLKILDELEKRAKDEHPKLRILAERPFFFIYYKINLSNEWEKLFTRCGVRAGRYSEISPDGYVYPCDLLMSSDDNLIAGDLRKQTFRDIWHNSPLLKWFRSPESKDFRGICRSCIYFDVCGGKCRALALTIFRDILAPDPRCPLVEGVNLNVS
jgi:Predicted Fe-S oxidoreductases